ncbi:hypothetical protein [Actinoplanes derwentensis]|uniref:Sigma-70, region 4 n=1 Tax=Actinoplanes derwentensis TaxID=113562 RepID=A0A1H1ZWG9_9ACTN|nr:hypothetical protein [Actinoplanes derwentensis]GID83504.1 hypothetical protein Ade03nite_24280 [Actinoplanes derwentensis]SDT38135.1 hypothetical protein SAMN04489716_3538 [Actinoplanes derwentensis]
MTGKPSTPRKRASRQTETAEFDAFARRILRAYSRRVAAGDVEALASLSTLAVELDVVTRLAVAGLRAKPYSYSWDEIARRLGVSKQAAQQRYGERTSSRNALDSRLLHAGLGVSVATLVQVFADHHPGSPAASCCPGCGFRYPDNVLDCPTNATVRPLLLRRRGEDKTAVARLSPDQRADLHNPKSRTRRATVRQAANDMPSPNRNTALPLFPIHGEDPAR